MKKNPSIGTVIAGLAMLVMAAHYSPELFAQNPFAAPSGGLNAISGGAVPSGGRAVQTARGATSRGQLGIPANLGAAPPRPAAASGGLGVPANLGAAPPRGGLAAGLNTTLGDTGAAAIAVVVKPKLKVITGTRVFDAVTGVLIDDAQVIYVEDDRKEEFYDDGTHGDLTADDNVYAKVDERNDVIGQSNQRIKERLIQAINTAEQLNPVEFYGYSLMTTDRVRHAPRNRRWKIVRDEAGLGYKMAEVATETPLEVPRYYEKMQEKDDKISGEDGWATLFLDSFRKTRGDLESAFYALYIPEPPTPPKMAPPTEAGWAPFANADGGIGGAGGAAGAGAFSLGGGFGF